MNYLIVYVCVYALIMHVFVCVCSQVRIGCIYTFTYVCTHALMSHAFIYQFTDAHIYIYINPVRIYIWI